MLSRIATLIVLSCAAILVSPSVRGAGTIYETSFEEGTDTPTGWHPPAKRDDWAWSNDAHTGKRSLCLIGHSETTGSSAWRSDPVPVQPNRIYRLRFWYKSEHEKELRGCGMGPAEVRIAFGHSAEWRQGEVLFWTFHKMDKTPLSFSIYHMKGKAFLDDVSIDTMGVAYLQQDGLVLSDSEKIQKGAYTFDWAFNRTTTNICRVATENTSNFMDNRIRFSAGKEVVLTFDLDPYEQLSGKLSTRFCYYIDGELICSASKDGKTWTELGRMSDRKDIKQTGKKYAFDIPKSLYPAGKILIKLAATGVLQTNRVCYEAGLSGSPPDVVGRTTFFQGSLLEVGNGPLRLRLDQLSPQLASMSFRGNPVGSLGCMIAQYDKNGTGYKGTHIDSSGATTIKNIELKKREADECVVEVTAERAQSGPCKRMFEAVYRLTLVAGQPWLRSRLLSVKNTDRVTYTVKGYYHLLTPADASAKPVCFPSVAGWVSETAVLGAALDVPDSFTLGLRKASGMPHGDITRKADAEIRPDMTWEGDEPEVAIFVCPEGDVGSAYEQAKEIAELLRRPASEIASGQITYEEEKQE